MRPFFAFFMIFSSLALFSTSIEDENGIRLYELPDFKGESIEVGHDLDDLSIIRLKTIGSVFVPDGYKVSFYLNPKFQTLATTTRVSLPDMELTRMGSEPLGSLELDFLGPTWPDLPEDTTMGVTLFSEPDFQGDYEVFLNSQKNMKKTWFGDNRACSMLVAPGYEVVVYSKKKFRGEHQTFTYGLYNLSEVFRCGAISSIQVWQPSVSVALDPLPEVVFVPTPPVGIGVDVCLDHVDNKDALAVVAGILIVGATVQAIKEHKETKNLPGPGVTFYRGAGYTGVSQTFYRDKNRMGMSKIGRKYVTSIRVPTGYELVLFEKPRYRGRTVVLTEDVANLDETPLGVGGVGSFRLRIVTSVRSVASNE